MTASQAYNIRAATALGMNTRGFTLREIAQVLRLPSKWEASKLVARGARLRKLSDQQLAKATGTGPEQSPVVAYVAAKPGRTCCQIARALGLRADTLSTTLRRLAAAKLITRRRALGQRRSVAAWRWYVGGAS